MGEVYRARDNKLHVETTGQVAVKMTLTAPSCPEVQVLPGRVEQVIRETPGVSGATVELVWEPPWNPQKMSEAARLQLGIFSVKMRHRDTEEKSQKPAQDCGFFF